MRLRLVNVVAVGLLAAAAVLATLDFGLWVVVAVGSAITLAVLEAGR